MKWILFLALTVISLTSFDQAKPDSILLLNGKSYVGEITGMGFVKSDSVLNFKYTNKKGRTIFQEFETRRIFSYTQNGLSRVVYVPNEFEGDFLTVQETKDVTIGSYDARHTFKPHVPFWTSFGIGLGASLWDTYLTKKEATDSSLVAPKEPGFFKGDPSIFPFITPVVLSVAWSFPSFKLKQKKMLHKHYVGNENYYRGYHRIAKQRRMLGALFGSLSGIAVGMVSYYIFH